MNDLPELKDIHLPTEGVSIFPIAYGWWAILLTAVSIYLIVKLFIYIRKKSIKLYAQKLLKQTEASNNLGQAVKMSEILRRICLFRYPYAVSLTGQDWVYFINSKTKIKFKGRISQFLLDAPYIPENSTKYSEEDVINLRDFCYEWIGENL